MSRRLIGREAIDFARAQEADDLLVRGEDGEWTWTSLADALEAQQRAEDSGEEPVPCVVRIDDDGQR